MAVSLLLAFGGRGAAQAPLLTSAEGSPFDVGDPSGQVALADLNGDGSQDVVASSFESSAVTVLLGSPAAPRVT